MPTNLRPETDSERITEGEASELRRRLGDVALSSDKVTLREIAEACGKDEAEVREALRALRQERAFLHEPTKKPTQIPMLLLALAMFGVAGTIYKLQPPRPLTDEEIERTLSETRARRAARPPKVHYPVTTTLKDVRTPMGTTIEIRGTYTVTRTTSSPDVVAYTASSWEIALSKAAAKAAVAAQAAEDRVPVGTPPPKPDPSNPVNFGTPDETHALVMSVSGPSINRSSQLGSRETIEWEAAAALRGFGRSAWEQQERQLNAPPRLAAEGGFPSWPGFTMTAAGDGGYRGNLAGTLIAPVNASVVERRIAEVFRLMLESGRFEGSLARAVGRNRPIPEFTPCEVGGLYGPVKELVPTNVSERYPSAIEVLRAQEQAIGRLARKVGDQLRRLNREAR